MKQRRTAHSVALEIEVCAFLHQHRHDLCISIACRLHESRPPTLGDERTRYREKCEAKTMVNHERDWLAQVKQRSSAHVVLEIKVCAFLHQHRHDLCTSIACCLHESRCAILGDERTRYTERSEPRAVLNHKRDWWAQVKQRRTAHSVALEIDVCTLLLQNRHDLCASIPCCILFRLILSDVVEESLQPGHLRHSKYKD